MDRASLLFLPAASLFVACAAPVGSEGTSESAGSTAEAIRGGANDVGTDALDELHRNVVVNVDSGQCTGTLISPQIVLTAKHCINGDIDSDGVFVPGVRREVSISVGSSIYAFQHTYRTDEQPAVYGPDAPTGVCDPLDVGLYFLNPAAGTVLEEALITRPTFAAPPASTRLYIAGWSMYGSYVYRQSEPVLHEVTRPPAVWSLDGMDGTDDDTGFQKGDSGGPLFFLRSDGARDPVGVGNCNRDMVLSSEALYTDVTNPPVAAWIRQQAQDTSHTANWLKQHGKTAGDFWKGEVDYTGPKRPNDDIDGDHWFNWHDNCPLVANTDQTDGNDDGVGDVCTPPPPPAPVGCTGFGACDANNLIMCPNTNVQLVLQRLQNNAWADVSGSVVAVPAQQTLNDPRPIASTTTYRVCAQNPGGRTCGAPLPPLTENPQFCIRSGGGTSPNGPPKNMPQLPPSELDR